MIAPATVSLERHTLELGRHIFRQIRRQRPNFWKKQFWISQIMEWTMKEPALKRDLFRLVDVLPNLRSSKDILEHISLYLGDSSRKVHPLLPRLLKGIPNTVHGEVLAEMMRFGTRQMAGQYIAGKNASKALPRLRLLRRKGFAFTVDLLGEYSVSEREAEEYLNRYIDCLSTFGKIIPQWRESASLFPKHPGERSPICISVKLTALYSQCSPLNYKRSVEILSDRLTLIAQQAKKIDALLYVDAEDSASNPIIYESFKRVFQSMKDFPYPGIVIQAYTKSSEETVLSFISFAKYRGAPIAIRLVKGAYWDHETMSALQNGWNSPLFHAKEHSDANYEKLSEILLQNTDHVLPAFASHNVRSLSHACSYAKEMGKTPDQFELQMLYGMADPIAHAFQRQGFLVRFYTPLGELLPGMGYLVRRLLENTSNESFLRHTFFHDTEVNSLLQPPHFGDIA